MARKETSNAAQIKLRIEEVKRYLLLGKTRSFIVGKIEEDHGLAFRQVDTYIKQATVEIEEVNKDGAKNLLAKLVSNQWHLYMKALKNEDLGLCDKIIMNIAKLRGLDVQKVVHELRELEGASEETLDRIEDELSARASYQN